MYLALLQHDETAAQGFNERIGCAPPQRRRHRIGGLSAAASKKEDLALGFDERLKTHQNAGFDADGSNGQEIVGLMELGPRQELFKARRRDLDVPEPDRP